jgi:DNA-directed RNA polymerase II subunit RPB2
MNIDKLREEDLKIYLDAHVVEKGLSNLHIDSFNNLCANGIHQIICDLFSVEGSVSIENSKIQKSIPNLKTVKFTVTFNNVEIHKPTKNNNDPTENNILYPQEARKLEANYSGAIYIKFTVMAEGFVEGSNKPIERSAESSNVKIGNMPIMVGSNRCNLDGFDPKKRAELGEDPNDKGGYFIIKGEWVVNMLESRIFNYPHIFRNLGHRNEITRTEIITKQGDAYENSSEMKIRLMTDNGLYITFSSNRFLKDLNIPFYVIFMLMGMHTDKEIFDNIVYGYNPNDVISNHMVTILRLARSITGPQFAEIQKMTSIDDLRQKFVEIVAKHYISTVKKTDMTEVMDLNKTIAHLNSNILSILDKVVMTQVGTSSDKRHEKLRHLGDIIHSQLLTEMEIKASTDRDSFKNKRLNTSGQSLAKVFKQYFNLFIVQKIRLGLSKAFKNTDFNSVDLVREVVGSFRVEDIEAAIIKSINTGNEEIKINNKSVANRLASEQLHRKNQLNTISTQRTLRVASTTSSHQDQRADEMRRVHPSPMFVVCPIQSAPTGESVGMVKQLAISAFIVEAGQSQVLIDFINRDSELIKISDTLPEYIYENKLTKVFVNGRWLGCVKKPYNFIYRYKQYRRKYYFDQETKKYKKSDRYLINQHTTINWDTSTGKIHFWLDTGRAMYPMLVVRNNSELDPIGQMILGSTYDKINNKNFRQDLVIDLDSITKVAAKEISAADIHAMGYVDYCSPEELENCLVAENLEQLRKYRDDPAMQFTHCAIPEALVGVPALTCPYADHNQPPRITFQTTQRKQTCGIYALNWAHRYDKHAVVQLRNQLPHAYTLANKYTYPDGVNAIVATIARATNQEDSLEANTHAMQAGLYACIAGNYEKVTRENTEEFRIPKAIEVVEFNQYGDYSKLDNTGVVKIGKMLDKNTVLVGKVQLQKEEIGGKKYKDQSAIYGKNEPAIVTDIVAGNDEKEGKEFRKIVYFSSRICGTGEKFSSRHGQKGMTSIDLSQADMPMTESGLSPDLCMNPHAIPSRMTIGQKIETVISKLNALKGTFSDATIFTKVDPHAARKELRKFGYDPKGTERMYNGATGLWIDVKIFIGPTFYQRLQKFGAEEIYAVSSGPTCSLTRQPLEGRSKSGGLRTGEMEIHCYVSQSNPRFMMEKIREDSDGAMTYACANCGNRTPIVNEKQNILICDICRKNGIESDIVAIPGCWASNILFPNEVNACGIGMKVIVAPYEFKE